MVRILEWDKALRPFERDINLRMDNYHRMHEMLTGGGRLTDFANAHEYYGFHHTAEGWVYREWAPGADGVCLSGEFNGWAPEDAPLTPIGSGNWELHLYAGISGSTTGVTVQFNKVKLEEVAHPALRPPRDPGPREL